MVPSRVRLRPQWIWVLVISLGGVVSVPLFSEIGSEGRPNHALRDLSEDDDCDWVDRDETQDHIPEELRGLIATASTVSAGDVTVDWVFFPLPYPDGRTWSIWGKGVFGSNGKFYAAVGDHDSPGPAGGPRDGNVYLYEYDPETKMVRAVGDALTAQGHFPGENGYGKMHGQIREDRCGLFYMHTYWGSQRAVSYTENYQGDILLRYNRWTKHLQSLGVKMFYTGTPSTNLWLQGGQIGLFYGEAADPFSDQVVFWVYDIRADTVIFESEPLERNSRNIAIDREGRAYFSAGGPALRRYDPATNTEELIGAAFSNGGWLRASTRAASDGTITLVSRQPDAFFEFDPAADSLTHLADAESYVADIEMDPTERVAYYVPGAHGGGGALGFPLREIDRTSGALRTIALLGPPVEEASGVLPAGTYSITVGPDGRDIYISANAGPQGGFGIPVLLVVHLPDAELP